MVNCPECGKEYDRLGTHWYYNSDHRPNLTGKQLEIVKGLLMGDGCIAETDGHCNLVCKMISPNYLKYLDNIFGCLGSGVSLTHTAVESAKIDRNSNFTPNAKEENYSDVYTWRTRNHPKFNEFREWYSSGEKVWPEDIELTPTVLKHWYVGDGHYSNKNKNNRIEVSMSNEIKNKNKISKYFINVNLPEPSNYDVSKRKNGTERCSAQWTVEGSYELWNYMGEPLPDFEYKWPEEYR